MPNIVDRFGQLVDDAIPKPELARQLLLLGYRAKDVQLLLAPEKELTPARQYAAQIAMDAMIAPLAHPQRAALVNIFMPCELLHAFHLLPMFAEATACYLNGAAAERGFIHYAESAGISPTLCSYHKALLGMGLSGTAGKPLFTACTSIACDANNLTFRRLAQHYGPAAGSRPQRPHAGTIAAGTGRQGRAEPAQRCHLRILRSVCDPHHAGHPAG